MACYYVQQKNVSSPTLLKTPCVHPHIFAFAVHFSFAIITKIYEKLKNANIISLSTCTKNTTELARLLVDFHKTNLLIEETRLVKKSRLKPGKEPHAAREPRVGHPWPIIYLFESQRFIVLTNCTSMAYYLFVRESALHCTDKLHFDGLLFICSRVSASLY